MSFDAITLALAKSYTDQHSGGGGSGIQPNWNQNDETAPDYVKNRPFYEETTEIEMLPETSFEIVAENTKAIISDPFPYTFEVGQDYTVTLDGETKTYTAINMGEAIGIASLSSEEVMKGNGWACTAFEGALILTTRDTSIVGTHTISISGPVTNIYKIDEKYLGEISFKMDKMNPIGEGAFSLNRRADTDIGDYSFAEGDNTTASGEASHAEGYYTIASGVTSHAEGYLTTASGVDSHAEGYYTIASGEASHAEGDNTTASGFYSHAEGRATIAASKCQHVQGKFNIEDSNDVYAHIIGGGSSGTDRKNIHTVDWNGNAWYAGNVEGKALIITSSTAGSTKRFKITVDDTGKLTATEVTS